MLRIGRLQIRVLRLRGQEAERPERSGGSDGPRRFPHRQVRLRFQGQAEGIEADRDADAKALWDRDEQEENPAANAQIRAGMPGKEGESAEEDREGDTDKLAVLEQAEPAVRHRQARRAPAHRHKLSLLRPARRETVLPFGDQGRVDQRDRRLDALRDDRHALRHRHAPEARFGRLASPHVPPPFRPGMPLHVLRIQEIPLGPRHLPIHVEEGELLGQRPDGELLRPREGRAAPSGMPGLRRRGLGDCRLHRLLQQLEAAGRLGEDDARGIQGLSPGNAHPPPRPPRRGERKREPLARGSRFSIDPGFLNVSLTWGPH